MPETHIDLVALLFGLVLLVAWFVRLEFGGSQNKKEIAQLWKKHDDLSEELREKIDKMSQSLARIEGLLSVSPRQRGK